MMMMMMMMTIIFTMTMLIMDMMTTLVVDTHLCDGDIVSSSICIISTVTVYQSYALNNAYYHFTGRLANEARALRTPLMERDQQLIVNGFIKQSHEDYLLLRDQCMTEAQKAAAAKKKKGRKKGKKGKKKGNCRRCRGVLDAIVVVVEVY